jgi:hypothetical protein
MGTFHDGMSELHGITVVVDTKGPHVYVGRCHDVEADRVILLDVDRHADGEGGVSKEEFVRRAARVGVWGREARTAIPTSEIASIRRLGEIPVE